VSTRAVRDNTTPDSAVLPRSDRIDYTVIWLLRTTATENCKNNTRGLNANTTLYSQYQSLQKFNVSLY